MVRKFGVDVFRQGVKDLLDLGERQARALLSRIPDGDYFFADYLDEDAPGGVPVPACPDPEDPRRRGGHGLLRVRRPAAIVAQRADRRRRAPHPADGGLHLLPLQHRPDDPPERRHHAAGALHHPRGHDPQSEVPGRRRHAQHDLQPAAGRHHRRVPVGGARPAAGRPRRRRRHHERQDDRQPQRPDHHGLDRPDHRRRRRLVGRRRRRRLGRQFELPQEHAGRDQRDRGADQGAALRPGARFRRRRPASRRARHPARVQGVRAQYRGDGAQPRPHALLVVGQHGRPAGRHLLLLAQPGHQRRHRSRQHRRGAARSRAT